MSRRTYSRPPRRGGSWVTDPEHNGVRHRNGLSWNRVRVPAPWHMCAAQSALVWSSTSRGTRHVSAVLWCACGAVAHRGTVGRWVARNLRRQLDGANFPMWHRNLSYLDRPAQVPAQRKELSDVDGNHGGDGGHPHRVGALGGPSVRAANQDTCPGRTELSWAG